MDWVIWWLVTLALLSHCLGLQQQQKQNDKEYVSITIIFWIFIQHSKQAIHTTIIIVNYDRTRQTKISQYSTMGLWCASTYVVEK